MRAVSEGPRRHASKPSTTPRAARSSSPRRSSRAPRHSRRARAADVFGLEVLQEAVQDFEYNITRFAIIGGAPPADANKTTIVFALPSTPGALFKALSVFALRDINLTKLESRPMRGRPWEYLFYVEVEARTRRPRVRTRADASRRVRASWTRVLGTL